MKPQIISGDCLAAMRKMDSASVDLIYLDPPFNTGKVWVGKNGMQFADIYKGDIDFNQYNTDVRLAIVLGGRVGNAGTAPYLAFIAERLAEMKRLLKPTGSIYLHCDNTAAAYIKILMDCVFGCDKYLDTITWDGGGVSGFKTAKRGWIRTCDVIFYYAVGDKVKFNKEYLPYTSLATMKRFNQVDDDGRAYQIRTNGVKVFKDRGIPVTHNWIDILSMQSMHRSVDYVGYPTQKPVRLLERIIAASSEAGDVVLDPFCGSGTTGVACAKLNRRFIGIDASVDAVKLANTRIADISRQSQLAQ